jgi:hypothetical protein
MLQPRTLPRCSLKLRGRSRPRHPACHTCLHDTPPLCAGVHILRAQPRTRATSGALTRGGGELGQHAGAAPGRGSMMQLPPSSAARSHIEASPTPTGRDAGRPRPSSATSRHTVLGNACTTTGPILTALP